MQLRPLALAQIVQTGVTITGWTGTGNEAVRCHTVALSQCSNCGQRADEPAAGTGAQTPYQAPFKFFLVLRRVRSDAAASAGPPKSFLCQNANKTVIRLALSACEWGPQPGTTPCKRLPAKRMARFGFGMMSQPRSPSGPA